MSDRTATAFSLPQGSPCPDEQRQNQTAPVTALAPVDMPAKAERIVSNDVVPVLDTAKFEHMWRVAKAIAASSLVPDSLRMKGPKSNRTPLPEHEIVANCFLVVNQAVRWEMDPFALIQHASIIHGRLCWEGKVIAAVLDSRAGIDLDYEYSGAGELMRVKVTGLLPNGKSKSIEGSVSQWKTTGEGSPWRTADYERQLAYRGAREWARRHKPAVMLGVYGSDERFDDPEPLLEVTRPLPPTTPPPRRQATIEQQTPETPASETISDEPAKRKSARPTPVRGKSNKPVAREKADDEWATITDNDERDWLKLFKIDLEECRNTQAVHMFIDRRQGALDKLSAPAKKKSTEIINHVLSDLQR